jgi:hypothetical protein
MRRIIGIDIHRTFGEVVIWENGELRHAGRVDMTRSALEGLGNRLTATDEVVIEATGNSMAVSRVLSRFVARGEYQFICVRAFHGRLSSTDCSRQTLGKEDGELRVGGSPLDGRLPVNAKVPQRQIE